MEKVVLAFSGGVASTAALHWLKRTRGHKVVALALNVGQGGDFDEIANSAIEAGADSVHAIDRRRSFVKQFCFKTLRAGARYQGLYYLSAALSRPLIATELVALAREEGTRLVAHGAPPKGNDQFRIEISVAALDPDLQCIAPTREWDMSTRAELLAYLKRNGLPARDALESTYSSDRNLWGVRSSAGELEDPNTPAPESTFQVTHNPVTAPDEPETVEIKFQHAEPVALNGVKLEGLELVDALHTIAARHGIGRFDTIEDRILGFKSREVYESPAAHVLQTALHELEKLTLDQEMIELKPLLAQQYAALVYDSRWFTRMRESLDAFFRECQQFVTGTVRLALHKGGISILGRSSQYSIYDREAAHSNVPGAIPADGVAGYLNLRRLNQMSHAFKQRPKM